MNFLALLLGLGVERALTHFFHLREFRWLDPLFDATFRRLGGLGQAAVLVALCLLALVLAAPVMYGCVVLGDESHRITAFAFAFVVLLFSLGPRDLQEEVGEYCAAAATGDADALRRLTRELTEDEQPADVCQRQRDVERAIYVQANNRIFGVVFWFLVLGPAGPAGAWFFRVTDLMRRRAAYARPEAGVLQAIQTLHGLLAWLPARLMAGGFALAGSFEGAGAAWRRQREEGQGGSRRFFERTAELIDRVGQGARGGSAPSQDEPLDAAAGRSAMSLVRRTLWLIWYPVIALLTLNDWLS